MKETALRLEDQPDPIPKEKPGLLVNAKILGKILQQHPNIQSNSPEFYMLAYLESLGSHKI